jgi:hypothetical protein
MKKNLIVILLFAFGCTPSTKEDETKKSLADELIGEWRNTYIKITMNSFNSITDSVRIIEADTSTWEAVLKMKPIRTFFEADGTYHSDHYSVNDSLLFIARGTWTTTNDTLTLDQTFPNVGIYHFKTALEDDIVTFSSTLDFDEDGISDDTYFGQQKKQ